MITKEILAEKIHSLSKENYQIAKISLRISEKAHKDQKRDSGGSYLEEHIYPLVVNIIDRYSKSEKLHILLPSIILHDVLEDSDIEESELRESVGEEVTNIVKVLTKSPQENNNNLSQEEKMQMNIGYLERIKKSCNEAILLKLEDRLQNVSSTTIEVVRRRPDKYRRYLVETKKYFLPLAENCKNGIDYKGLFEKEISRLEGMLDLLS